MRVQGGGGEGGGVRGLVYPSNFSWGYPLQVPGAVRRTGHVAGYLCDMELLRLYVTRRYL